MTKYNILLAADVRAYGSVEIEANSIEDAKAEADKLLKAQFDDERFPTFKPEYDTINNFELIDIQWPKGA